MNQIIIWFWNVSGQERNTILVEAQICFGNNRAGDLEIISSIETWVINGLIIDTRHLTRKYLCSHQDDAMRCYDYIIRNYAMLNNRKFGVPNKVYKVHDYAYDNMQL